MLARKHALGLGLSAALAMSASPLVHQAAHADDAPSVAVSIKPIHSLVSSVMQGVGEPTLLLDSNVSPHNAALRPSQARAVSDADLVVWVGEGVSTFLIKPIAERGDKATLELVELPGIEGLEFRDLEAFSAKDDDDDHHGHAHDDHGHKDKHEDHAHGHEEHKGHAHDGHGHKGKHDDHAHGHEEHKDHAHDDHGHKDKHDDHAGHEDHHGHDHAHDHDGVDPHIWLDPHNAEVIAKAVAEWLIENDAEHASVYEQNRDATLAQLEAVEDEVESMMEPLKDKGFVVFHDAYQYFENRFDLQATGVMTFNPETPLGARRVQEMRETLSGDDVTCLFSEPQFDGRLVGQLAQDLNLRTAVLDPIGQDIPAGPDQYATLLRNMAGSFKACLSPTM